MVDASDDDAEANASGDVSDAPGGDRDVPLDLHETDASTVEVNERVDGGTDAGTRKDGWCGLEEDCPCRPPALAWPEVDLGPLETLADAGLATGTPTHLVCDTHLDGAWFDGLAGEWWGPNLYVFPDGSVELMSPSYDPETHEFKPDHGLGGWKFRTGREGVSIKFADIGVGVMVVRPDRIRGMEFDTSGKLVFETSYYPCPPCGPPE